MLLRHSPDRCQRRSDKSIAAIWKVATLVLALCAALPVKAQNPPPGNVESKPLPPVTSGSAVWRSLTPAQKQILAPLAPDWHNMDADRRQKWLALAERFASMSPQEQQRAQERMAEWVKLTPQQRKAARRSFAEVKQIAPEEKSARWEAYQQLPEDKKKKLAAKAAGRQPVTRVPPTRSTQPPITRAPTAPPKLKPENAAPAVSFSKSSLPSSVPSNSRSPE